MRDVRHVPYRLPGLMTVSAEEPIFIVEGEKDADALAALGLTATTNVGGAGKWHDEYTDMLRGTKIVVLPDNDAPGRKHAEHVASSLSSVECRVKVLPLPGLAEKGDVSDWLARGGNRDELLRLVSDAKEWAPAHAFPVDVLPVKLAQIVKEATRAFACPLDLAALPILAAAGAAIGGSRELEVKPGWREGPRLFAAVVADPGEKKSPVLGFAMEPLEVIQGRLAQMNKLAREEYDEKCAAYEAELGAWGKTAKNGSPLTKPPRKPEPPTMRQILTTDTTIEALADLLHNNPRGILVKNDELTGWALSMNQYRGGHGSDRQNWLSLWSAAPITVNRKGKDPLFITKPIVSVIGCLPPDVLNELADPSGREDGFIHRLLFAFPNRALRHYPRIGLADDTRRDYAKIIDALHDLSPETDVSNHERPKVLRLTPDATVAFGQAMDKHNAEMNAADFAAILRGPWAKMDGYLVRLTLILHLLHVVCSEADAETVDIESVLGAARLIEYFKIHARRVYGRLHADTGAKKRARANAFAQAHGGRANVREFQRAKVAGVKTAEDTKALLLDLEQHGLGSVAQEGRSLVYTAA